MGNPSPKPQYLAEKLLAIRKNFGLSQLRMARLLQMEAYTRLSEFERGRRIPSLRVLIYYARLAGVPLEFIVDDDIDVAYFKYYLTIVEAKRRVPMEQRVTLFWRNNRLRY